MLRIMNIRKLKGLNIANIEQLVSRLNSNMSDFLELVSRRRMRMINFLFQKAVTVKIGE